MPLEEGDTTIKIVKETDPSLFTYTFTAPNNIDGSQQLLLQNNLTEDTMYLQDLEDATTGWTLDGLPVLFPNDGQPILINQEEVPKEIPKNDKVVIEPEEIYTTVESTEENYTEKPFNGFLVYQIKEPKDITEIAEIITTYKCKKCVFTTESKDEIQTHFQENHQNKTMILIRNEEQEQFLIQTNDGMFEINGNSYPESVQEKYILVCSQCSKGFESVDACKQHMINDHKLKEKNGTAEPEKIETPPIIENTTTQNTEFLDKKILKSRKTNLPFKCEIRGCSYRFATKEVREAHMKCHVIAENGSQVAYKCSECNLAQKTWRTTALHLWRQHNIQTDLIACPICFVFKATVAQLENHMMIHSDKKSYSCPHCGKLFKQASQLRNHWIIHNDKTSDKRPTWLREIECPQCQKMFSSSKSLKKHLQSVHSKLKPFICNVCGHSCARKAMLQLHLRQHTGEKPYACDVCNYRTGDHNTLRRHNMIHTGKKPYKCPHCPYTSIQSSPFKYHIGIKHPGKTGIFSCNLCKFQSVSETSYQYHLSDHEKGFIPTTKTVTTNADPVPTTEETSEPSTVPVRNSSSDSEEPCYVGFDLSEEPSIDNGGITIPAEPECSTLLQMALLTQ